VIIVESSVVAAQVDRVWARVVTADGINDEMRPWLTMTMPRGARHLTVETVPLGVPVGRAWLRLLGVIPFDYDRLSVAALVEGRSFHEKSTMLSMSRWEHERTLTPLDDGRTKVHDRITFVPRLPLRPLTPVLTRVIRAFFVHRHRRLGRHFS
jgi:ligand-binding SRPBCC domain-containing protein